MDNSALLTIMSTNLKRSIQFYTENLGFKLIKEYGEHFAEIEIPGVKIGLHPTDTKYNPTAGKPQMSIGITTKDLDEDIEVLGKKGIRFSPVKDDQSSRFAYFSDPDGTPFYLIEFKFY